MITYKVNFDYEYKLYDLNSPKNINDLEYIFFLIQESPCRLLTSKKYSEEFLNIAKSVNNTEIEIVEKSDNVQNWWGKLQNIKIEREINSKINFHKILKSEDVITDVTDINQDQKYFVQSPYLFSGIGNKILNGNELKKNEDISQYLIRPYYKKVIDLGIKWTGPVHDLFISVSDEKGAYKGTYINSDQVEEKLKYRIKELILKFKEESQKVFKIYAEKYQISSLQIDGFIAQKEDGYFLVLSECNYRRTMTDIIKNLRKTCSDPYAFVSLSFKNSDKLDNNSIINLSPKNSKSTLKVIERLNIKDLE